jgi:hypothetical protein
MAGAAWKGNPTAVHFLCAKGVLHSPDLAAYGKEQARASVTDVCQAISGFTDDQRRRARKKGDVPSPKIAAKFGYDVKAGMHVPGLLHEWKGLSAAGTIPWPTS